MVSMNGHGGTPAAIKPEISSCSLRHRDLTKSRRAAVLACVLENEAVYIPTAKELARHHDVPESYVSIARGWSPEKRAAVAAGTDQTSIAAQLNPPGPTLALPAPKPISDNELASVLGSVIADGGIDRVLNVAIAVANDTTA